MVDTFTAVKVHGLCIHSNQHAIYSAHHCVYAENQVLKLPAGKYTVREREMMTGSGLVPAEFFHASSALSKSIVIGECLCSDTALTLCWHIYLHMYIPTTPPTSALCIVCGDHKSVMSDLYAELKVVVQPLVLVLFTHYGCGARSKSQTTTASR